MNKLEAIKYGYPFTLKIRFQGEPWYLKMTEAIKEHQCEVCSRVIGENEAYYCEIYPRWEKPDYFQPARFCWDCVTLQKQLIIEEKK